MLLTGKQFNKKYKGVSFFKLTNKKEVHNGFKFTTGLNIDTLPLNNDMYSPGGIPFTDQKHMNRWLNYSGEPMKYIRCVTIPSDASVVVFDTNYKTDKMVLGKKMSIYSTPKIISYLLKNDPSNIADINSHFLTNVDYMNAVQHSGDCLQHVPKKKRTYELCKIAVENTGWALQYVPKHLVTPELCKLAVTNNGRALEYVPDVYKSFTMCKIAIKQDPHAVQYSIPNLRLYKIAVRLEGTTLEFVDDDIKTYKLCKLAVRNNSYALRFVPDWYKTEELCSFCYSKNKDVLRFIPYDMRTFSQMINCDDVLLTLVCMLLSVISLQFFYMYV
jgi:hypothetical protein